MVISCKIGVRLKWVMMARPCTDDVRVLVPESWDASTPGTGERRRKAAMPADAEHREKWRLGLEMIDEVTRWGVTPSRSVATVLRKVCGVTHSRPV